MVSPLLSLQGLPELTSILSTNKALVVISPTDSNLSQGHYQLGMVDLTTYSTFLTASLTTQVQAIQSSMTSGLTVAQGGTGIIAYTAGNYLNAASATTLQQRTPAQVLSDIGAFPAAGGTFGGAIIAPTITSPGTIQGATLTATGNANVANLIASGAVNAGTGFNATTTTAMLSSVAGSPGTVILRPNGYNSTTGQFTIGSDGAAYVNGPMTVTGGANVGGLTVGGGGLNVNAYGASITAPGTEVDFFLGYNGSPAHRVYLSNTAAGQFAINITDASGGFLGQTLTISNTTGLVNFIQRPTFSGAIPWDNGNLPAPASAGGLQNTWPAGALPGISDANAPTATWQVFTPSTVNTPYSGYGAIWTFNTSGTGPTTASANGNWLRQFCFDTNGSLYFRQNINAGGWPGWNQFWHTGNLNPGNYALLNNNVAFSGLTVNGSTTVTGSLTVGTYFNSNSTYAVLSAATTGGEVLLRPNGYNSSVGQLTVDQYGNASVLGSFTALGTLQAAKTVNYVGPFASQQVLRVMGWSNNVPRWKDVMEADGSYSLYSYDTSGGTATQSLNIMSAVAGGANQLHFQGNIVATGSGNFNTSDRRLKKDIVQEAPRPLHRALRWYRYSRTDMNERGLGPMAQDVETVETLYVKHFKHVEGDRLAIDRAGIALENAMWAGHELDQQARRIRWLTRGLLAGGAAWIGLLAYLMVQALP